MNLHWLQTQLRALNIPSALADFISLAIAFIAVVLFAILITMIVRRSLLKFITHWIQNNNYRWDDPLASNQLLAQITWFVPIIIFSLAIDTLLASYSSLHLLAKRLITAAFVVITVLTLNTLLSTINDIHRIVKKSKGSSLRSFVDAGKILTYILGVIFLVSVFTGKSPWGILSVLGGLTAVTMLVFKDSILGFVASIQLNSTDMVHIGDWIEMPQYGADGDVIEMSIHSIRIQNWDKTITTIPTYALVSSSFKNWRGMSESGGRRIKRSINIDIHSIKFCNDAMIDKFSEFGLIKEYVNAKQVEIEDFNKGFSVSEDMTVNGRRQTNIGVFRAYVIAYLKSNPQLNSNMTFLVRQLAPTERGLPLEIYVFSKDQAWANYEAIQADIFDHLLAAAPNFDLRIFQSPSGFDFRALCPTSEV